MDLMEIGAALREARERTGLSIEVVEERTKISQSVIIALEEGNSSKFPHPVYARGFVRSYAMLLGLDEQQLCAEFSREYPVPVDMDHHGDNHGPHITVRFNDANRAPVALWIASAMGIVALGLGGWYAYDTYLGPLTKPVSPVSEPAPTNPAPQPTPTTMQAPTQSAPLTQMQEITDDTANASGDAQTASATTAVNASAASEATPPVADMAGKRTMVVSARSASWLQARTDDKVTDYFLRKGESATLLFSKSLTIKFGNLGGVDLTLDGKSYPVSSKQGEVKTVVIK
jgi:cytoskeleton protein RodZ